MPYDNPFLKELGGYFKSPEPGVRERADAWATAIGLQKVDGLEPSQYLLDLAKRHYSRLSARKMIPHFCRFIAQVWQIHPFGEGNTRTTAVFAVKYLRSLGFRTENNMFKDNSWYFRNALVRANFADFRYNARRDLSYLEAFFRNLLLGENNLLKSRLLLIGMSDSERDAMMASLGLDTGRGCQKKVVRKRLSEKRCQKTAEKIVELMRDNPEVTQADMACALSISRQAVQKHIARLKSAGRIRRVGPDNGGHWEVV